MRMPRRRFLRMTVPLLLPLMVALGTVSGLELGHRVDSAVLGAVIGVVAFMTVVHALAALMPQRRRRTQFG